MGFLARIQRTHSQPALVPYSRRLICALVVFTAAFTHNHSVFGVEQAEAFVKGLQQRGLDELALEYLEQLKTSPLADEAMKKQIPYLRGTALVEQSRRAADATARNKLLDEARAELEKFAAENPNAAQSGEASLQLATVEMSRGQEAMAQAAQLPKENAYDTKRRELGQEARQHFAAARETYQQAEAAFSKELEKLPPTTSTEARDDTGSRRQELRGRVAQSRFLAAQMQFESAQSYDPKADEFRKFNEDAAQELANVYDEFGRTMLVGLYARLYEGRCYQAVGNFQLALGCYDEILGKSNPLPPFRKLAMAALHRKAETLISQGKLDAAIDACRAGLKDAQKDEEKQVEWLAVRFRLADALTKKALSLPADSPEQRRDMAEAREAYRIVARSPNEFQTAARAASSSVKANGVVTTSATDETTAAAPKEEPKTFQAAYDLGKDALAAYNAAKLALPSAEKNNPPAVPELQAQMNRGKEDARTYFRIATTLIDVDTDPKFVNEVRYFLCWLYWEAEDYYRAAVLGEFLARRYPDHASASSAAKIAMASFERLFNQAVAAGKQQNNGDFEASQMAQMAQFIVRRWPGTPDADAAFGVLVGYAIRTGNTENAEKMLAQASEQSRPRLELLLGNALWGRYLELSQPGKNATTPAALAALKSSATKYLQSGLEAARKESRLNESAATASLYLIQSLLNDGNYAEAISRLEDATIGPLTLIKKEDPSAAKPQYAIEAYKAALRAYVSVTPPQDEKAVATMQALEKVAQSSGDGGESAEQLTRIYVGMGVALQQQMEELRAAGKRQEADRVSGAFATFLDRIASRSANANWPTRAWLAQMYYTLGAGKSVSDEENPSTAPAKRPDKAARDYLIKARDAYSTLLDETAKNAKLAPSDNAVLAVRMQLGECYRELGQYQQALDLFSEVLKEKESSLAVQRAAAMTYQLRGQFEDAQWFEYAIHGGYKLKSTGQNRLWGWLRISQVTGRAAGQDQKFRDTFYEARLNISRCRYWAALKQTGAARQQDLAKAKQSIQSLAQLYPDLGGAKWKPSFDGLLQAIQREESKQTNATSG